MTKVSFSASVFVIALTSMWHTAQLSFAQDFYAGKTIRIIVGFPAGGGFDTYSRIIGRHFGKFIPGNPAVVVDNVTGAGSLVAANMIYKVAKPDGLTIGNFIGNLVSQQLFGGPGVEFDARKFEWIGVPTRDHVVCALTKASGITSIDAWMAAKPPVKLGGSAPGTTNDDSAKLLIASMVAACAMGGESRMPVLPSSNDVIRSATPAFGGRMTRLLTPCRPRRIRASASRSRPPPQFSRRWQVTSRPKVSLGQMLRRWRRGNGPTKAAKASMPLLPVT
jgi:hypothetical protein